MKVKELMAELKVLNPNAELLISADAEGNRFMPLDGPSPVEMIDTQGDIPKQLLRVKRFILWPKHEYVEI